MIATRSPSLGRLLIASAVAVVVLGGIWITGAVVTNDFTVSMWATAAWIAVAAVAILAVAVRSRRLRWPVLAGGGAAAATPRAHLGPAVFFDHVVAERVAVAGPASGAPGARHLSRNVLARR